MFIFPALIAAALLTGGQANAVTHEANVPDTTSVSSSYTVPSNNGPVWAYDNLERDIQVTATGANAYRVTFAEAGSYRAFADPRDGSQWNGSGPVVGYVTYDVTSPVAPNAHNIPRTEPSTATHGSILTQLFGQAPTITGSSYGFLYGNVHGQPYSQAG
jgi:hypothetical protein